MFRPRLARRLAGGDGAGALVGGDPAVLLAAAFYFVSLGRAATMLLARREELMAIVEGRG